METLVRIAWGMLALIHVAPATVLFSPAALTRLYGVAPDGDVGVLLTHRGAMFLALVGMCLVALATPGARAAASVAVAISVVGFLAVYVRAGTPAGALRTIAWADVVALAPLAVVLADAVRLRTAHAG